MESLYRISLCGMHRRCRTVVRVDSDVGPLAQFAQRYVTLRICNVGFQRIHIESRSLVV
jgi:hypothetical protein